MKDPKDMNLAECLDALREMNIIQFDIGYDVDIADRIHELTRWIPISERMPTEEDAYKGQVLALFESEAETWPFGDLANATAWQRITPPETKP